MTPPSWTDNLFDRLQRVKELKPGKEWEALCPAHDDHSPSLVLTLFTDSPERLVPCCRSGCSRDAILSALGINGRDLLRPKAADYSRTMPNGKQQKRIVATYPYTDEAGILLYEVVRYQPKSFNQRRPTDKPDVYLYNLEGVRRVLYRLPEVLTAVANHTTIFLVEGEKDADNLRALGLVATTCAQGAAKWKQPYSETLRDADVVILPDNDDAGCRDRDTKGAALHGIAAGLRVLDLPGLPDKGDVSDWLNSGGTAADLLRLAAMAPDWTPPAPPDLQQAQVGNGEPRKLTDLGNGERLVDQHGQDIRYCYAWSQWLIWNGRHWQPDETGEIARRAKATVRSIYSEAAHCEDDGLRGALAKHAHTSEKAARVAAMIDMARSETGVPVLPQDLDAAPFLLNCHNGEIDLQTGRLRPHRRQDLLTKLIPIDFDASALCPVWEAFLLRILPDADVRAFVQRAVGYSLTGDVREQCLFFLFGSGSNGKSTFISMLEALIGDYACRTRADVLMQDRNGPNRGATPDLVKLQGRRLVTVTELQDGQRLDEALIKDLTGGDTISARDVYKSGVEFRPTHKMWLAGNHKPTISGTDMGIWRRPRLIPFTETIGDEEKDPDLSAKLAKELPGVLAWAVRGCLEWQRDGLRTPDAVKAATQEYKTEMDTLGAFISEYCVCDKRREAKAKDLYDAYVMWCKDNGERHANKNTFGRRLTERGFENRKVGGTAIWRGIDLTDHCKTALSGQSGTLLPDSGKFSGKSLHETTSQGNSPNVPNHPANPNPALKTVCADILYRLSSGDRLAVETLRREMISKGHTETEIADALLELQRDDATTIHGNQISPTRDSQGREAYMLMQHR